jgi:Fe-S cluster biogenesis protein NfuA
MLAEDELVSHLLLVHGLHPVALSARVENALASVRPYLATHGGNVELVRVESGVAHIRLQGTCHGCPSSTATLTQAIEQAVFKAAPDLERVAAEGVAAPDLISLESLICPIP